jgi:hypothetical protein
MVFFKISLFIRKNKKSIQNIISYSNHDTMIPILYCWKKIFPQLTIIAFDFPKSEDSTNSISIKTRTLLSIADRIIIPASGTLTKTFFSKIDKISQTTQNSNKIIKCYSSLVMDCINSSTKCPSIDLDTRNNVTLLLGCSPEETRRHLPLGLKIINSLRKLKANAHPEIKITTLYTDKTSKSLLEAAFRNLDIDISEEISFDYSTTKTFITIKNSLLLFRPLLFGCQIIPFYRLDLRSTFLYKLLNLFSFLNSYLKLHLTPNRIAGKELLPENFLFSFSDRSLLAYINNALVYPDKKTQLSREDFVRSYLAIKNEDKYELLVNNFFHEQKQNYKKLADELYKECTKEKCLKRQSPHKKNSKYSLQEMFAQFTALHSMPEHEFIDTLHRYNYNISDKETVFVLITKTEIAA